MDFTIFLLVSVLFLVAFLWFLRHDPRLPPCPATPLPLFGHLLYMDKNPRKQLKQWRKKCGEIYSLYLGQNHVVVLNGYDLIKEALIKNGDKCSDRPYMFFDVVTGKPGLGVVFSSGALWKEQRAVSLAIMKELGIDKSIMTEKVAEVVTTHIEILESLKGEPTDLDDIITTSVANIICSFIMGQRFNHDDKEFVRICNYLRETIHEADGSNLANYFKFWSYLPGDLFGAKRIRNKVQYIMSNLIEPYIQRKGYDEFDENNLDNYIAMYVFEMKKKLKTGEPTTLNDENLKKIVYDLFGAGVETTSTTIKWCLLYFLHYPDIQEKIYREIEMVCGTEKPPTMSDKFRLPYFNAFLQETQRLGSIVPLNVLHLCTEDLTVGGYTLPKGTQLMPSLDSILFDKKIWGEDAGIFKPERFLDENGKVIYPEQFVPFSLGRRVCLGASLAKVEMFLFMSSMVQKFKFLPVGTGPLPTLEAVFGLTANTVPYKVLVVQRKAQL